MDGLRYGLLKFPPNKLRLTDVERVLVMMGGQCSLELRKQQHFSVNPRVPVNFAGTGFTSNRKKDITGRYVPEGNAFLPFKNRALLYLSLNQPVVTIRCS